MKTSLSIYSRKFTVIYFDSRQLNAQFRPSISMFLKLPAPFAYPTLKVFSWSCNFLCAAYSIQIFILNCEERRDGSRVQAKYKINWRSNSSNCIKWPQVGGRGNSRSLTLGPQQEHQELWCLISEVVMSGKDCGSCHSHIQFAPIIKIQTTLHTLETN